VSENVIPGATPVRARCRPGVWIVAGLVLAAVALPGGLAAAHLVPVAPRVGVGHALVGTNLSFAVNLTDTPAYAPRELAGTVNGTVNVSVRLQNIGSIAHTFTVVNVSQVGTVLNRSWTPQNLSQYFATYPPLENVSVAGGASAWANFSLPANATFRSLEFVSVVPYQFQAGMWGFLNLTPMGPTVVLQENTTATSFQFLPNVLSAGPHLRGVVDLHILITNLGSLSHTFTVAPQSNVTLTTIGYFATHTPLVNQTVNGSVTVWANFSVPGPGVYEYACTVLGHFADGMWGLLYVGVPVPPAPPAPSTAIVEIPVLAGSAVLLGIGLFLALGAAYTGRFPKRPGGSGGHY
jgi:hypothetical protein